MKLNELIIFSSSQSVKIESDSMSQSLLIDTRAISAF